MINSREELRFYCEKDRIALSKPQLKGIRKIKEFFLPDEIWKFERLLRYTEYYHNTLKTNILHRGGICGIN